MALESDSSNIELKDFKNFVDCAARQLEKGSVGPGTSDSENIENEIRKGLPPKQAQHLISILHAFRANTTAEEMAAAVVSFNISTVHI